jgi:hypothetical protein
MPGIPSTNNPFCIAEYNLLRAFCNDYENGKRQIVEGGIAFFANASSLIIGTKIRHFRPAFQ